MNRKSDLISIKEAYDQINETSLGLSPAIDQNVVPSPFGQVNVKVQKVPAKAEECENVTIGSPEGSEDVAGPDTEETNMAKTELFKIHNYSKKLHDIIERTPDLEPWVFSKITLAGDYLDSILHYLEYKDFESRGKFNGQQDDHEYKVVSKIRDLLTGENKDTIQKAIREAIFQLELRD